MASPPSRPMATSTPLPENPDAIPYGVRLLRHLPRPSWVSRIVVYRVAILLLTYFFYVAYHLARRPLGVVKNVLRNTNCSGISPPANMTECDLRNGTWCAWEPFDTDSQKKFSVLDFTYRFSYAIGMIFAGHIAERTDLRLFVSFGMVMAGLCAIFNGMAYFWKIHSFSFFVLAQLLGGIFQGNFQLSTYMLHVLDRS
jgi:MFS transporter, OPA family, solute carrier family 37 (glycerol-3-phosphate transporter), member 1/2